MTLAAVPDFSVAPPTESLGVARSRPQAPTRAGSACRGTCLARVDGTSKPPKEVRTSLRRNRSGTPCRHGPHPVVRPDGRQYDETLRSLCFRLYLAGRLRQPPLGT